MDFFFSFLFLALCAHQRGKTSWRLITLIVVLLWIEHSFGVLLFFFFLRIAKHAILLWAFDCAVAALQQKKWGSLSLFFFLRCIFAGDDDDHADDWLEDDDYHNNDYDAQMWGVVMCIRDLLLLWILAAVLPMKILPPTRSHNIDW